MEERGEITAVLDIANSGDPEAMRAAFTMLYDRMRIIARHQLGREAEGHTLETDGLVNEAFLRLLGLERVQWRDREHVLAMGARMMRRVLIDYADRRQAMKRGGGARSVELSESMAAVDENADELRALDEALCQLEAISSRQARVVECRFFGGLSVEETAETLSLSPATVKRDWACARAWLNRELGG